MEERIVSGTQQENDYSEDTSLRPRRLTEYIGQERLKANLEIAIAAARLRGEPLDHTLLHGPPGLGKTTLANIIANEMDAKIKVTSGPAIERPADMVSMLTRLESGDVLFIDEVHRLPRVVEEVLYGAMEDFVVSWVIDKGLKARSMNLSVKRFTLIGATTRYGMVSSPMRDRFGSVHRLDFYSEDAMRSIVERSARILDVTSDDEGVNEISRRSRGTPRVGNRLLRRVRDYAQVKADGTVTGDVARDALERLEVDALGLDDTDHLVLRSIIEKFAGGPVGIETLAAAISEEADTIMDVYEPFLLQMGFLDRTRRGRVATRRAYDHLGFPYPEEARRQASLF
ncbi:MAG: Holliday junction branch migration DNA helicase RuvB [SAR202 cluster bacterium]|nr:Holliday junction branch migration DNA helicase RuvB [SAR202 cluster bacterium]